MEHITVPDLALAVFQPEKLSKETAEHIEQCKWCKEMVEEEKRENPIFEMISEVRRKGGPNVKEAEKKVWRQVRAIQAITNNAIFLENWWRKIMEKIRFFKRF